MMKEADIHHLFISATSAISFCSTVTSHEKYIYEGNILLEQLQ